jgi:two-component system phosphate regulon sensor histidine kinase PhoR
MSEQVSELLSGIPNPILLLDTDARITTANLLVVEMFGHDPTGLIATTYLRQATVLTGIDAALRENRASTAKFLLAGRGSERVFDVHFHPIKSGAILTFVDSSASESADRIRRDFIANISHELRTPLTGLTGFIETLRTSARDDAEARDRFLGIMENEARRMGRMVEDLLSLSRVEADERVRPRAMVNVSGVLRSAIATLEGKLQDANVQITTSGLDTRFEVQGDRDQLTQLYLNLFENAVKYGGRDKIVHVSIAQVDRDPALRVKAVRVDIRDQGDGIDALHLPRLTERFYRVDDHRSRDEGGTGLGLSIVKHIVNRHRGRMKITSNQGEGSTFSTILPSA